MSLMNYLGAVASAAMEAAATAAIQQGSASASATASNVAGNRGDQPVTAVVSTNPNIGGGGSESGQQRASVTVPQGLSGFSNVVPITITQSSGPSGQQIAYAVQAISNGSMRLAHPHVQSGGTQRTFTLPVGMTLSAGQVPNFSFATGNSSQPTVEIRVPHAPPTLSSQVPAPVGSHLVDKQQQQQHHQQRPSMYMNAASFRGTSIPVTPMTQQPGRPPMEHEIRREMVHPDHRIKQPMNATNLNTSRPSVLMSPRNSVPPDYMPRADPAVALQDHNYTLPKRLTPPPPQPTPGYAQLTHHHHHPHHKEPVAPLPSAVPTLPMTHLPAPSPPHNKMHMSHAPPPLTMHPKPPPPNLYGNVRGVTVSPPVTADVVAKVRRPRSESPVTVPGRRRRRKAFDKNKDEGDILPGKKPGVPGRKRSRKQAEIQAALNNTIPPYTANNLQDQEQQLRNPLIMYPEEQNNTGSIPIVEQTKRRLKKNKHDMPQLPQQYGRKLKDKEPVTLDDEETLDKRYEKNSVNLVRLQEHRKSWESKSSTVGGETTTPTTTPTDSRWGGAAPPSLWRKQSPPPMNSEMLLKEKDTPAPSNSSSNNTASSANAEDHNNSEGITRCICDYLHDDGFMICCDNCLVWQHVDCMGIDRNDIPEAYLCEICNPRWVSKSRARAIQTRKKEMMDFGVVEDDSAVGDSDQDGGERSRVGHSPGESSLLTTGDHLASPGKSSGKLKRRGRPSLSNGQPFSDSDSEVHLSSALHSPTAKRSRKYSGKRAQNLSPDFDSPSKIGSRKRRSSERGPKKYLLERRHAADPPKTRRSYTRRNTITSPLSSPGREDSAKGVEDHKENSLSDSIHLDENGKDSDERGSVDFRQDDRSDSNGVAVAGESRRKRKQIFKDIPNGDLSPPHIIPSTSPSLSSSERHSAKSRSPSFDKTLSTGPANSLSNNVPSAASSPDPIVGVSGPTSSLQININMGFNAYSCPYSTSPYLDKYEEAENAVCSYSPELRAKLLKNHGGMLGSSSVPDFAPLPDDGAKRWKLGVTSLEGGKKLKTLLAAVRVEPGNAIIEFIGKFLMHTGFIPTNKKANSSSPNMISPEPFVFFHQVPKNGMCICIDSRKYGNDARFVRRSCVPNAEIRHVVGKGTIHAYVVATSIIDVDDEVTIPHEFKSVTCNTMNSVVQKYHVIPPPLPCACSDLDTCKAVIHDAAVGADGVVHKKNGALFSPTSAPQEIRERKRRMSSRRTSLIDKDPVEPEPSPVSPQQHQSSEQEQAKSSAPSSPPPEEPQETTSTSSIANTSKDRSESRTTRARTVANAQVEEPATPTPVTSKRKSDATPTPSASTSTSKQRHRSGAEPATPTTPVPGGGEQHSNTESHKLTREERKLQSVLKLIERMESNQKKKESRQNQKKDKTGKEKKSDDRETDHDEDSQSNSVNLAPIRFAPVNSKKKGRKRGRSTSKSGNNNTKPQMISQRNSGSIADLRSTSTESDLNSADEGSRAGMSPLQENMGPNFRLPKKKELMSEWRIGTGSQPSPTLPSQYMRKSNSNSITTSGTATPPVQPSTSSASTFLVLPVANGNLDNASAKKRWLRQAISEETDPSAVPSPNSRPSSPVGVECLAPLKKRRLARASMSSEVSNTPPSTPNNAEAGCSEMDAEGADDAEQNEQVGRTEEEEEEEEDAAAPPRETPSRKWSCSEVSSAEEDMDELDESPEKDNPDDSQETPLDDNEEKSDSPKGTGSESTSPNRSTTPRRSRWDQVDAPEPVVNSSNSNSPVKSTSDAIVLDYVRNPEHYAKLTGLGSFEAEKSDVGGGGEEKETTVETTLETGENEESQHGSSFSVEACRRNPSGEGGDPSEKRSDNVDSSPKTPTQVKKKLSMAEYFKRKKEGHSTDERSTALSNSSGTALNSMTNSDSNSSDHMVMSSKEGSSPRTDDEPSSARGTLQFSSTPTLAERKREELGKRLSKSFGIRVPDAETVQSDKQVAHTSPREPPEKQQKPNGDITPSYVRSVTVAPPPPPPPPPLPPPVSSGSIGHRLSVPTPAALKQSGMPPLPPQHLSHTTTTTPNGSVPKSASTTPNGFVSSAPSQLPTSSYSRIYRSTPNGPSISYSNHQHSTRTNSISSQPQGQIIGGVPVGNLIPPPPPPGDNGGQRVFAKRFYNNKRFFQQ